MFYMFQKQGYVLGTVNVGVQIGIL